MDTHLGGFADMVLDQNNQTSARLSTNWLSGPVRVVTFRSSANALVKVDTVTSVVVVVVVVGVAFVVVGVGDGGVGVDDVVGVLEVVGYDVINELMCECVCEGDIVVKVYARCDRGCKKSRRWLNTILNSMADSGQPWKTPIS